MSPLDPWPWEATSPKGETFRFRAVTYVEARAKAAARFRVSEMVVRVRVLFEHELKAKEAA